MSWMKAITAFCRSVNAIFFINSLTYGTKWEIKKSKVWENKEIEESELGPDCVYVGT